MRIKEVATGDLEHTYLTGACTVINTIVSYPIDQLKALTEEHFEITVFYQI